MTLAFTPLKLELVFEPVATGARSEAEICRDRCRGGNDPGQGWITGQTHGLVIDDVAVLVEMKLTVPRMVTAPLLSIRKKPAPLIEISSGLLVVVILPWVKLLLDRRQRHPDSDLAGSAAGQGIGVNIGKIGCAGLVAYRTAFAMLLLVESMAFDAVFSPLKPCWNAMFFPLSKFLERH